MTTTNEPRCSACGKPFADHLGLQDTCELLQQVNATVKHSHHWMELATILEIMEDVRRKGLCHRGFVEALHRLRKIVHGESANG